MLFPGHFDAMLKSYEAIYENGQVTWLAEQPPTYRARVIVTILEDPDLTPPQRTFPTHMVGQVKILANLSRPLVDEDAWECLK
jgi:hypothetical protein